MSPSEPWARSYVRACGIWELRFECKPTSRDLAKVIAGLELMRRWFAEDEAELLDHATMLGSGLDASGAHQ